MQHLPSSSKKPPSEKRRALHGLIVHVVDFSYLETIQDLNLAIFNEERVINTFDRADLLMMIAHLRGVPVGFKIGYRHSDEVFYSAKGGVLPMYRRRGVARTLLHEMMDHVRAMGYTRFIFDTFPNKNPGMTILGLKEGFQLAHADYNAVYKDYRLQFVKEL